MVGSEASVFNPSEKGIISFYLGAWWTSPSVSCLPTNFGYFGTQPHSMISKERWRQGSAKAFLGCSSPTKYIYYLYAAGWLQACPIHSMDHKNMDMYNQQTWTCIVKNTTVWHYAYSPRSAWCYSYFFEMLRGAPGPECCFKVFQEPTALDLWSGPRGLAQWFCPCSVRGSSVALLLKDAKGWNLDQFITIYI